MKLPAGGEEPVCACSSVQVREGAVFTQGMHPPAYLQRWSFGSRSGTAHTFINCQGGSEAGRESAGQERQTNKWALPRHPEAKSLGPLEAPMNPGSGPSSPCVPLDYQRSLSHNTSVQLFINAAQHAPYGPN